MSSPFTGALPALLYLRPGCAPDQKTEPHTGVRQPVLRRGRSPHAQKATSERWFEKKRGRGKKTTTTMQGKDSANLLSERGSRLCSWSLCHHFVDFQHSSAPTVLFVCWFYFHSQKKKRKKKKPSSDSKSIAWQMTNHTLNGLYIFIFLYQPIYFPFFFFLILVGTWDPNILKPVNASKQEQPPRWRTGGLGSQKCHK